MFAGMKGSKTRQMLQVGVDPFPGFVVNFLHVFLQPGFVWVFLPAGWTHVVDALHVFDQLVGHFEHLLTILTGKELTRGFMFSDVDLQVERLGEGYHTLFALQICFISEVVRHNMLLHHGVIVGAEVALPAVVAVSLSVELDVDVDLRVPGTECDLIFRQIKTLGTLLWMALLPFGAASEVLVFGVF